MDRTKIIDLMAEKGLTKSDLADKAHVSRQAVYRIVNNGVTPRLDTLGKVARVLGVKPSELLKD
ncbi:helix-turn-helix transcriptional regulator [Mitsuokella sp.]|uniref:helix-turn-helix transcriptional regulator n=1 Tax=Mitsuokella sp. TaxID=2049034 RepID=UPI003D7C536F